MEQSSIKESTYNYRSFDQYIFQKVVNDLNLNQKINNLIICGVKSAYILKETSEAFKQDARTYYHQLIEIDSLQTLPDDDYVKLLSILIVKLIQT